MAKPKVVLLGPFSWRDRRVHPCQGLCESATWHYKKHKEFPQCKHSATYLYKGKEYCQLHLGQLLIKENME